MPYFVSDKLRILEIVSELLYQERMKKLPTVRLLEYH
jgi:hypothetical protein